MFIYHISYVISVVFTVVVVFCLKTDSVFTIHTKGCTIPAFPVNNKKIEKLLAYSKITNNCSEFLSLIDYNRTYLWVDNNALPYYNIMLQKGGDFYCCYRPFSSKDSIEDISYGECIKFLTVIKVEHEFIRTECYYQDEIIYDDFFAFTKFHKKNIGVKKDKFDYNVLILGIESMSRINFLRTMPQTAKFLKNRGSIQLHGYNKLGDNSLPNLIPLLTGKSLEDYKVCFHNNHNNEVKINTCKFMWDVYKDAGFVTALGSDSLAGLLGTSEYRIRTQPTDYYIQPFIYETRNLFANKRYNYHMCVKKKFVYKILLDYISDITENEENNKVFGIFWEESVTHEHVTHPRIMDTDYLALLKKMERNGYLKKTVVIFFSDHGIRWGDFVQTEQGRHEERLPLLEVLFPRTFKQKFSRAFNNFKKNSRRLTTPYDMHYTLLDLVNPTSLENKQIVKRMKTQNPSETSIFLSIPENRTCHTSGISLHWCACRLGKQVKSDDKIKTLAATNLIFFINKKISNYPQCRKLKLKKILEVSTLHDNQGITYVVMVEASPGGAIFDGTLRQEHGIWALSGTVSRYNVYRDLSECVEEEDIKLYCFCK